VIEALSKDELAPSRRDVDFNNTSSPKAWWPNISILLDTVWNTMEDNLTYYRFQLLTLKVR
jgi:hypothetical protein